MRINTRFWAVQGSTAQMSGRASAAHSPPRALGTSLWASAQSSQRQPA